jgi:signal transduction histidine kinase
MERTLATGEATLIAMVLSRAGASVAPADCSISRAYALAIVLALVEVALDLGTWVELDIANVYVLPLVVAAFTRNRRLLWTLTAALTLVTFAAYAMQIPPGNFRLREALFVNRVLDAAVLLLTAGLIQLWMTSLDVRDTQARLLEEQNRKLALANDMLVEHEAQIVRQNADLGSRHRAAEEASERKTRLLNAVSHDIRNPANAINLLAEVIRRSTEDPSMASQVPQMTRRLQSNAQSLVALVSQVLDVAHLDSGLLRLHESTFSLNEFIDTKSRDLEPLAEAKALRLDCAVPERAIWVHTDRVKLDRIVTNLVTNAIKFTATGRVTVRAALATDGVAVIRVEDTGVGIAQHEVERIFDEFSQFSASPAKTERGWGLGLAICRRLTTFIGASIGVESQVDRGAVFTVRLPPERVVDIAPVPLSGNVSAFAVPGASPRHASTGETSATQAKGLQ